jgi:hypothetical protein
MFFESKSLARKLAVLTFLGVSLVCQFKQVDAFVCLKRAILGSFAAYVICTLIVKTVNALVFNAIINKQLREQTGRGNDDKD